MDTKLGISHWELVFCDATHMSDDMQVQSGRGRRVSMSDGRLPPLIIPPPGSVYKPEDEGEITQRFDNDTDDDMDESDAPPPSPLPFFHRTVKDRMVDIRNAYANPMLREALTTEHYVPRVLKDAYEKYKGEEGRWLLQQDIFKSIRPLWDRIGDSYLIVFNDETRVYTQSPVEEVARQYGAAHTFVLPNGYKLAAFRNDDSYDECRLAQVVASCDRNPPIPYAMLTPKAFNLGWSGLYNRERLTLEYELKPYTNVP